MDNLRKVLNKALNKEEVRLWRFSKNHLRGSHYTTLPASLNREFLKLCEEEDRTPTDMLRILVKRFIFAPGK